MDSSSYILGKPFKTTYNPIEKLRQNEIEDIPTWKENLHSLYPKEIFVEMFSAFGLAMALGDADFDYEKSLNKKYPEIETTKVGELVQRYWHGQ